MTDKKYILFLAIIKNCILNDFTYSETSDRLNQLGYNFNEKTVKIIINDYFSNCLKLTYSKSN